MSSRIQSLPAFRAFHSRKNLSNTVLHSFDTLRGFRRLFLAWFSRKIKKCKNWVVYAFNIGRVASFDFQNWRPGEERSAWETVRRTSVAALALMFARSRARTSGCRKNHVTALSLCQKSSPLFFRQSRVTFKKPEDSESKCLFNPGLARDSKFLKNAFLATDYKMNESQHSEFVVAQSARGQPPTLLFLKEHFWIEFTTHWFVFNMNRI